nr:reverse transcriptase domain-containing protein [Tanacetum cinerariifolium]
MRTRSRSRYKIAEPLRIEFPSQEDQFPEDPPKVSMADNRTMAQLLQAPTEGYEDAIVIPETAATNFELKHGLINLVQNKQFFGHEDPHAHIRYFNKITSTMRVPNFFTPSKTTNLRNKITRFQQRFDESFSEAWDRFNDLLRACPHHGFFELHQLDIFYNALNVNDQDSLNSAAGSGTLPGPTTPTPSKVVKQGTELTKDQVQTPSSQSTAPVQPLVAQSETLVSEPVVAPVSALMPNLKPSIPYPSRRDNERRQKFSEMARTPMNEHCLAVILNKLPKKLGDPGKFLIPCEFLGMDERLALADLGASINLMPLSVWEELSLSKLTPTCMTLELADRMLSKPIGIAKDVSVKVGVFQFPADFVACEEYSQEVLGFSDVTASGSLAPSDDSIVSTTSPTLTLFGDSDFLLFEKVDAFLGLEDDPDSPKFDPSYYDPERTFFCLNPWVSPVHCVPKKGGFTIVENEENELIPTRLVTEWRVCIDYQKLNEATRKDHFPLPFMDQMLERLAGNEYYCFLDGFFGYFQILIDPHDQEKTTFTCPYGRSPIDACLSVYAMHQARFKGVSWLFFTTWLRRLWKSLWTTSRSLGIFLKTASLA